MGHSRLDDRRALFGAEIKLFVAESGGMWRDACQPQVARGENGGEFGESRMCGERPRHDEASSSRPTQRATRSGEAGGWHLGQMIAP